MKKTFLSVIACCSAVLLSAQVNMPAASPTQTIKQEFAMSSIELTYSRPSLKGRVIMGDLEPWDVLWRTGANNATKITFHEEVEVFGKKVAPGSYAIYTIPRQNGEWTFILNKGANNAGTAGYKEADDVLRVPLKVGKNAKKVETLTMQFSDLKHESCILNIKWDDFSLQIPIKADIKEKLRAQIEQALNSENKPYWQAAQFYVDIDQNYTKAIEMIDAAMAQHKTPPFYMIYYKAVVQKQMGDKKGALATAQQALQIAKDIKADAYVRWNEKLIKELKK